MTVWYASNPVGPSHKSDVSTSKPSHGRRQAIVVTFGLHIVQRGWKRGITMVYPQSDRKHIPIASDRIILPSASRIGRWSGLRVANAHWLQVIELEAPESTIQRSAWVECDGRKPLQTPEMVPSCRYQSCPIHCWTHQRRQEPSSHCRRR